MGRRIAEEAISVERFTAVTPADPRVASLLGGEAELSPLEAACALSHRDVWTLALNRKQPRVMILEDDVFFHKTWRPILEDCLERLDRENPDWDLFLLNASGIHTWEEGLRAASPPLLLSGAYVVNAPALEALLKEFRFRCLASDYMLVWLQEARKRSYFHFPYLALQEFLDSDTKGKDQEYVRYLRRWFRENYEPSFGHLYRESFS
jgi:GR25 family glycosyltransferase involved in LPS biosynthesis